jgi:hypothetical protein
MQSAGQPHTRENREVFAGLQEVQERTAQSKV